MIRLIAVGICDIMVSTFKIGGNRRFFGVCTANFVRCKDGTRAIPVPVADVSRQIFGSQ